MGFGFGADLSLVPQSPSSSFHHVRFNAIRNGGGAGGRGGGSFGADLLLVARSPPQLIIDLNIQPHSLIAQIALSALFVVCLAVATRS